VRNQELLDVSDALRLCVILFIFFWGLRQHLFVHDSDHFERLLVRNLKNKVSLLLLIAKLERCVLLDLVDVEVAQRLVSLQSAH
jgi:hypothetical protein